MQCWLEDSSSLYFKSHPDPILVSTTRQTLLSSTRHTWSLHIWTGHQEDKEDACPSSIIDNAGLRNEVWFSTKRSARRPCADPAEPPSSRAEGENGTNNSFEKNSRKGVYFQALWNRPCPNWYSKKSHEANYSFFLTTFCQARYNKGAWE